jgi:hypothetical protein
MSDISNKLKGGDLRSVGKVNSVIEKITNQQTFDELFKDLFDNDRLIVMRTADAVEKITITHPEYLKLHKKQLLDLLDEAVNKELKWHLAQLISRLNLNNKETSIVWAKLTQWAKDKSESRIVRVLSLQSLFDIQKKFPELKKDYTNTIEIMDRENIPSIKARIRILKKQKTL